MFFVRLDETHFFIVREIYKGFCEGNLKHAKQKANHNGSLLFYISFDIKI